MRHRPAAVLRPPEYPRPVIPADLTEDQQDQLLDQMMAALLTGRSDFRRGRTTDVEVRVAYGGDWRLDDDVVEF
jgi:hypothetical protein